MARTLIGGVAAGVILFLVGALFWASPLSRIAYKGADPVTGATVQTALHQSLSPSGTGTYIIPTPTTAEGTILYGRGPIATIHFNTKGFPANDLHSLLVGFLFAVAAGMLIAFGLVAVGGGGRSFASTARLVVLFTLGFSVWTILAQPVFNHHGWTYWVYTFVAQSIGLIAAGLAVAYWFLPAARAAPADMPSDV